MHQDTKHIRTNEDNDPLCCADAPSSCNTFFEVPNQACLPATAVWPNAEAFQQDAAAAARCIDSDTGLPTLPISSSPTCDAVSLGLYSNLGCPECSVESHAFTALLPECLELPTQAACEAFDSPESGEKSLLRYGLDYLFKLDTEAAIHDSVSDTVDVTSSAAQHAPLGVRLGGRLHVGFGILCLFLLFVHQ